MLKSVALGVCLLAASSASALTCLESSIIDSFQNADERPEAFVIGLGTVTRTGDDVPDGPDTGDPDNRVGYSFPAQFVGGLAGLDGFGEERALDLTVEVQCAASWCGGSVFGEYGLYFLRSDGAGQYAFESTVCPLYAFEDVTEHDLQSLFGMLNE